MFETIVWATDGSEAADRGLPYVRELAGTFGAKVIVAHSEFTQRLLHIAPCAVLAVPPARQRPSGAGRDAAPAAATAG